MFREVELKFETIAKGKVEWNGEELRYLQAVPGICLGVKGKWIGGTKADRPRDLQVMARTEDI